MKLTTPTVHTREYLPHDVNVFGFTARPTSLTASEANAQTRSLHHDGTGAAGLDSEVGPWEVGHSQ